MTFPDRTFLSDIEKHFSLKDFESLVMDILDGDNNQEIEYFVFDFQGSRDLICFFEDVLAKHGLDKIRCLAASCHDDLSSEIDGLNKACIVAGRNVVQWSKKSELNLLLYIDFSHLEGVSFESNILTEAATFGMFPVGEFWRVSYQNGCPTFLLSLFRRCTYTARRPCESDIDSLVSLEKKCWPELLAMPEDTLASRVSKNPEGHYVFEESSRLIAVVYTQKIHDISSIYNKNWNTIDELHAENGKIVQLLALNVDPECQHRGLGDKLLEFALQACELTGSVDNVVGVTRCKDFIKHISDRHEMDGSSVESRKSQAVYEQFVFGKNVSGGALDPVLRLHQLHGAAIEKVLPKYRPSDDINLGCGVLVRYDLKQRQLRQKLAKAMVVNALEKQDSSGDIGNRVRKAISDRLGREDFDEDGPLMEQGLDSADLLALGEELSALYKVQIPSTFFFEFNTYSKVVQYLLKKIPKSTVSLDELVLNTTRHKELISNEKLSEKVAVVGISCRLPGGITNLNDLWALLTSGGHAISSLPKGRWQWPEEIDISGAHTGIDSGGFLSDAGAFDADFFNISPREAELMDPQQRELLQLAWECFEDAGCKPSEMAGSETGVYVGASGSDYQLYLNEALGGVDAYTGLATSMAILPNRLSYFFDLCGPSMLIDTACSSSLVALLQAHADLIAGRCEQALVGGIHVMCHPLNTIAYYKAGMLSPQGLCKTFDTAASGYVRSEGAVVVMLKPLSKAIENGDQIYGVLNGGAVNHGGKSGGLTVPNPTQQCSLIEEAHKNAGVEISDFSYLEAHGTGTPLGDPIELSALSKVFRNREKPIGVGSLKAHLGHLEAAAGIAALAKVLACFKYGEIPKQVNFDELNEHIDLADSPLFVVNENVNLDEKEPVVVGISSFGSGGANAHAIAERYVPSNIVDGHMAVKEQEAASLIILSAKTPSQLHTLIINLQRYVKEERPSLASLSYTLQCGREVFPVRFACLANSIDDLIAQLSSSEIDLDKGALNVSAMDEFSDNVVHHAKAWLSGIDVKWSGFWKIKPVRISLPTYPFERQQYWYGEEGQKNNRNADAELTLTQEASEGDYLYFSSELSTSRAFVRDHKVNEESIFPAVAYVDVITKILKEVFPQDNSTLHDLVFHSPIKVSDAKVLLYIALDISSERKACNFEVFVGLDGTRTLCASGKYSLENTEHVGKSIDVSFLAKNSFTSIEAKSFYSYLRDYGLVYGSLHTVITKITPLNTEAEWFLCAEYAITNEGSFDSRVGVLDSALQAMYAIQYMNDDDSLLLPYMIESCRIYSEDFGCGFILVRRGVDSETSIGKLDAIILNQDGVILAEFCGVMRREYSNRPSLSHSADELILYKEVLRSSPLIDFSENKDVSKSVIIVAENTKKIVDSLQDYDASSRVVSVEVDGSDKDIFSLYQEVCSQVLIYLQAIVSDSYRVQSNKKVIVQIILCDFYQADLFRGLAKLLKCVQLENPKISAQFITLDSKSEDEVVNIIRNERYSSGFNLVYRGENRFVVSLQAIEVGANVDSRESPRFFDNGVYVISGGFGGLGKKFARLILSSAKKSTVILLGRSRINKDDKSLSGLSAFAKLYGSKCVYKKVDISNKSQLNEVMENCRKEYGYLSGIIHAAGVIRDGMSLTKSLHDMREVFSSKISGLINLNNCTASDKLDFFITFSSTSGVFGNVGQADYAAANSFVDQYMKQRSREKSGISLSISWPLWESGGMTIREQDAQRMYEMFGLSAIKSKPALDAFFTVSALGESHVVVGHGDKVQIQKYIHEQLESNLKEDIISEGDSKFSVSKEGGSRGGMDESVLKVSAEKYLANIFSKVTKQDKNKFIATDQLERYGIDSIMVNQLTSALEEEFGELSKTLFFEYRTLEELAGYFIRSHYEKLLTKVSTSSASPLNKRLVKKYDAPLSSKNNDVRIVGEQSKKGMDIAIVGLAGRYPKADSVKDFWNNLQAGKDCVEEVPVDRWDMSSYYDPEKGKRGKSYSKWGGFIDGIEYFDPLFFNISPQEAENIDPQERIFLQCVYHTLEDAGYTRKSLAEKHPFITPNHSTGANVGVFVGVMYEEYQLYAAQSNDFGLLGNISSIANRVSYFCDFHGPSFAVDTMCSSSLTAIHLACESIMREECDAAIAGGVNLTVHPNKYLALSQGLFVSQNGRCLSFGKGGDGYVPAEGVGSVLLKSLSKAQEDGDHIYGVIKGSAINHGGKNNGYTVPNPNIQAAVVSKALERANVHPRSISYVEAHGTGTSLGDPIEMTGLTKAFSEKTSDKQFCSIGSAKSNIGHAESAAGIAGLTKILLQMQHRYFAPSLHAQPLNPNINFDSSPFFVQQKGGEWHRPNISIGDGQVKTYPRIAGLSSFGAGGANAHLVVEEYESGDVLEVRDNLDYPVLIVLSARSEAQLRIYVQDLRNFLVERKTELDLISFAYTLQVGREGKEVRLAFEANSVSSVLDTFDAYLNTKKVVGLCQGVVSENAPLIDSLSADFSLLTDSWFRSGALEKIIDFWCKGAEIDWHQLYSLGWYGGALPRRISLPLYPFSRVRCWVDESKPIVKNNDYISPLLHKNTSTVYEQRFESEFSGNESFLLDHKVKNVHVLPAAAYIEMLCCAFIKSYQIDPGEHVGLSIRGMYFEFPGVVNEEGLHTTLNLFSGKDNAINFTVVNSEQSSLAHGQVSQFDWFESHGEMGETSEARKVHKYKILLEEIESLAPVAQNYSADEVYEKFKKVGLEYGPAHKALGGISVIESDAINRNVVGKLILPKKNNISLDGYFLHPSLLDAAFQSCLIFFDLNLALPLLPFAIGEITIYRPLRTDAKVLVSKVTERGDAYKIFDLQVFNEKNDIVLTIEDFVIRQAKSTNLSSSSKDSATPGELIASPVWNRFEPDLDHLWKNEPPTKLLFISSGDEASRQYEKVLRDYFEDVVVLNSQQCRSIQTIQSYIQENYSSNVSLERIVWIPEDNTHIQNSEDIIKIQEQGVITAFYLVKALLLLGYDASSIELSVLTRNNLNIASERSAGARHSALYGYFGSLLKEYPQWRIRVCDCDQKELPPVTSFLSLPFDPDAKEIIYRHGIWYRKHLLTCELPREEESEFTGDVSSAFKVSGCYVFIGGAGGLGEVFSEYLIKAYRARVIWIGRRAEDEEISAKCDRLQEFGERPIYISVDTTSTEKMRLAAESIRLNYGEVNGLIHTALVLRDKGLATISEDDFRLSLHAKINAAVNAMDAFGHDQLDFALFFSSLQSMYRPAGQSNYAAGCAFVDAYAQALNASKPYPVKTINWGYWGSVGVVASEEYRERMSALGFDSIEPEDGFSIVERFLKTNLSQLVYVKTNSDKLVESLKLEHGAKVHCGDASNLLSFDQLEDHKIPKIIEQDSLKTLLDEFEKCLAVELCEKLECVGLLGPDYIDIMTWRKKNNISPDFYDWLDEALRSLAYHNFVDIDVSRESRYVRLSKTNHTVDAVVSWQAFKNKVFTSEVSSIAGTFVAHVNLVESMFDSLEDIIFGKKPPTEVMFPNASLELVEGVYKNNTISDFYNEVLSWMLCTRIHGMLKDNPNKKVRILEVGSGTGGTSARLFQDLAIFSDSIAEYAYTDISQAFLTHAEENYRNSAPYMRTKIFDVTRPTYTQKVDPGTYDFVVATNVLHATPDIVSTLRHCQTLLSKEGLLLINELWGNTLFLNLTFGFLSGWWLSEDKSLRVSGSPLLDSEVWRSALEISGFSQVVFPVEDVHGLGQQIIVAQTDAVSVIDLPEMDEIDSSVNELMSLASSDRGTLSATEYFSLENKEDKKTEISASSIDGLPGERVGEIKQESNGVIEPFQDYLKTLIADALKMPSSELNISEPFESYGVDSILVVRLTNALRKEFKDVSSTLLFEVKNLRELSEFLLKEHYSVAAGLVEGGDAPKVVGSTRSVNSIAVNEDQSERSITRLTKPLKSSNLIERAYQKGGVSPQIQKKEDVAIVGISGRFPQSKDLNEFWDNLCEGRSSITEIPELRWRWQDYETYRKGDQGGIYTRWGGFINDVDAFDSLFFNISPREAQGMDPQERLFLQCVYHTLEDSGFTSSDLSDEKHVGVFVGIMNNTYQDQPTHWSVANRVSYYFDFNGPSLAIDTACSSSLSAIILASEKIRDGSCDACIAGGVNLIVDPSHYRGLSDLTMLSETDRCASFGAEADGFVDGEGVGAVLLMPLSKAKALGAQIYGVIKGGAINHGGRTNGYTVPNPRAQASVVTQACQEAGVSPEDVSYIEAHGTGTSLGDPIEIAGLSLAFSKLTNKKQFCSIGSVKSNIGHAESAAGIAAISKVIMQLKHQQLAPSLHSETLNPNIDFDNSPFYVQKKLEPWVSPQDKKRIAGISSFGAGGANAHIIIEEFYEDEISIIDQSHNSDGFSGEKQFNRKEVVLFSAKSETQLKEYLEVFLKFLSDPYKNKIPNLSDVAHTLRVGRPAYEVRLGLVVDSLDELCKEISHVLSDESGDSIIYDVRGFNKGFDIFYADEDFQSTLTSWIEKGKYKKLIDVWCKGVNVDWKNIYFGDARRVSLPLYVFEKNRFWKKESGNNESLIVARKNFSDIWLHPLVQKNTSTLSQQKFTTIFTGDEFFLSHHKIKNKKTLPSSVMLEIGRASAACAISGDCGHVSSLIIRDVIFVQPLFTDDNSIDIDVHITSTPEDGVVFEVCSFSGDQERVHAKGSIYIDDEYVKRDVETIDLEAINSRCTQTVDVGSVYELFHSYGIDFGEAHRVIRTLRIASGVEQNVVLTEICLPKLDQLGSDLSSELSDDRFVLHPSLLDGVFQSSIGLIISQYGMSTAMTPQPFMLRSLEIYQPLLGELTVIAFSNVVNGDGKELDVDFYVCNDSGEICLKALGFCSRLNLTGSNGQNVKKGSSEVELDADVILVPRWEDFSPSFLNDQEKNAATLLLGVKSEQLNTFQPYFDNLVCLSSLDHFSEREISIEDIENALTSASRFDHILVILPKGNTRNFDAETIRDEQKYGVYALYRLVQALLRTKYDHAELNLTVITQAARTINASDESAPGHSSAHGFVGAIIKEYPNWNLRLVDVDDVTSIPIQCILTLPINRDGLPVLYRKGIWLRQSLVPVDFDIEQKSLFRDGGVYLILGGAGGAGLALSRYLVSNYNAQMIWIGRRKENELINAKCDEIAQLGKRPFYVSVDATDLGRLYSVRQDIERRFGPVNGIVHAALVMSGAALPDMDERRFSSGLAPKLDAAVCVQEVFSHPKLDFSLFFSSIQAFDIEPKQSNYSAGTTFTDGFAESLALRCDYPVKVINWGYISETEFVSMLSFQQWMEKEGLGAVDIVESMPMLEKFMSSQLHQCLVHRVIRPEALKSLPFDDSRIVRASQKVIFPDAGLLPLQTMLLEPSCKARYADQMEELDTILTRLLFVIFQDLDLFSYVLEPNAELSVLDIEAWKGKVNFPTYLGNWLHRSLDLLTGAGLLSLVTQESDTVYKSTVWGVNAGLNTSLQKKAVEDQWIACRDRLSLLPEHAAQIKLIDTIYRDIPKVLTGQLQATQMLFPSASVSIVEEIYKNNPVSDFFNEVLAESLLVGIEAILSQSPESKVRILEVGAGTGGTSQLLFKRLSAYEDVIEEYCYTDISTAFLKHARTSFGPNTPYLQTRFLNIESLFDATDIDSLVAKYDFVVATNVLHATSNIDLTLRHVKALLKPGGFLLLNELTKNSMYLHLSFGLLEGWWLPIDAARRIDGSPLLEECAWRDALESCGFPKIHLPANQVESLNHQIFVAQSDGVITLSQSAKRQERTSDSGESLPDVIDRTLYVKKISNKKGAGVENVAYQNKLRSSEPMKDINSEQSERPIQQIDAESVTTVVKAYVKEVLMLENELDVERPFADYGVDSVTGIRLVEKLNELFGTQLSPTTLFDFTSVKKLVDHIHSILDGMTNDENVINIDSINLDAEQRDSISKVVNDPGVSVDENYVRENILLVLSNILGISSEKILFDESFADYGVDSVTGIRVVEQLNEIFSIQLSPTSLFDYSSVKKLVRHIVTTLKNNNAVGSESQSNFGSNRDVKAWAIRQNKSRDVNKKRIEDKPIITKIAANPRQIKREAKSYFQPFSVEKNKGRLTKHNNSQASQKLDQIEPIAIIGISGRFAKTNNVEEFWHAVLSGEDLTESVSRWDLSQYKNSGSEGFCDRGGFLKDIEYFDATFFNISGVEASYIDPQQRLFLEDAWLAMEDAGYAGERLEGRHCGVYTGFNGSDYDDLFLGESSPAQALWGNAASLVSARIAYYLDLKGPAITIDTACSSSLSAIHMACQSLRSGETELALAGGVFVQSTSKFYEMANRASMLSADGKCHTFDEKANGFAPGEGVGVLMLKKLSHALKDGDHIYGVVQASGMNQDGTTNGITAPSAVSQEQLIVETYKKFGITPETIQTVEAHGTGTKLGDPIEVQALTRAYEALANETQSKLSGQVCALGAVKSNIGHTTAASGVAGVIKLLMSLKDKKIAPSINFENKNSHIDFENSPFFVPTNAQPWPSPVEGRRRAAISSFGLSGTNVHAVIEEAPDEFIASSVRPAYLIVLSAISQSRLFEQVKHLLEFCASENPSCMDLSYTLSVGRRHFSERLAIVVDGIDELKSELERLLSQGGSVSAAKPTPDIDGTSTESLEDAMQVYSESPESKSLAEALALLRDAYASGQSIKFEKMFRSLDKRIISLPKTVFKRKRYWVSSSASPQRKIEPLGVGRVMENGTRQDNNDMSESLGVDHDLLPSKEIEKNDKYQILNNEETNKMKSIIDSVVDDNLSIDEALDLI